VGRLADHQNRGARFEDERLRIITRTHEGRKIAQGRGVRMGRKPKLTPHQIEEAQRRLAQGRVNPRSRQELSCECQHDWTAGRMTALQLLRIDAARRMNRFYRLDVQPDLFGGVLLVKQWGRVGARGRIVDESYDNEALAADAMQKHAERKRRRGYVGHE
jgi:predicted DNA-binding WGR domain protein